MGREGAESEWREAGGEGDYAGGGEEEGAWGGGRNHK